MKTTLNLNDQVLRSAKGRAARVSTPVENVTVVAVENVTLRREVTSL